MKKSKGKIIVSMRCFFPRGAFLMPTREMARIAREVGYDGIEFLPTWTFVYEMLRFGELTAPEEMVASGHRDWRFDRVAWAIINHKPWWFYQLRNREDWLFPPSGICLKALQKFQKRYEAPVSTIWFDDTKNFFPVMLELLGRDWGIDQKGVLKWVEEDPSSRGIVIDTGKFPLWLKSNQLIGEEEKVLSELLPYTSEVHYRGIKKDREWLEESNRIFDLVLKMGFEGRIVVELGWPDVDESIVKMFGEDFRKFRKIHLELVERLRRV